MNRPIGVFDSGVGGLSIALGVRSRLPAESLVYVADQQFSPYGIQPKQLIEQRSEAIVNFLCQQGCKAVVVACNTATVHSIDRLRSKFNIPLVGVEPAIKPAALASRTGVVGILATDQTLGSGAFHRLKERFSGLVCIETQGCPQLVECVEAGDLSSDQTLATIAHYVQPLLDKGADHIVLGCTHFEFLRAALAQVVKGQAKIIDTALPVAEQLARRLARLNLLHPSQGQPEAIFWSSDASISRSITISALWGCDVDVSALPLTSA